MQFERAASMLGHHRMSLKDLGGEVSGFTSPAAAALGAFPFSARSQAGGGGTFDGGPPLSSTAAASSIPTVSPPVVLPSDSEDGSTWSVSTDSESFEDTDPDEGYDDEDDLEEAEDGVLRRRIHSDDSEDNFYTSEEDVAAEADDDGSGLPCATSGSSAAATPTVSGDSLRIPRNPTPDARRSPLFFARHKRMGPRSTGSKGRPGRRRTASYAHLFPPADSAPPVSSIENHGLIGNCLTTALVSSVGSIDWMCFPHHDSPALFYQLLDQQHGGFFRITAASEVRMHGQGSTCHVSGLVHVVTPGTVDAGSGIAVPAAGSSSSSSASSSTASSMSEAHMHRVSTKQMYAHDSNVLLTRYFTDSGVGHVMDFMPQGGYADSKGARSWLIRELECGQFLRSVQAGTIPTQTLDMWLISVVLHSVLLLFCSF
jgi:hypothetical protein